MNCDWFDFKPCSCGLGNDVHIFQQKTSNQELIKELDKLFDKS